MNIARCICTDQSFADLLDRAKRDGLSVSQLVEATGAGGQCTRCLPYLRRCVRTGETVFHELLSERDEPPVAEPIVMSWSGGKDSAMALLRLQRDPRYEVVGLMTTVSLEYRRVSHHGVREELLEAQAEALQLPLQKVFFPPTPDTEPTMEAFDAHMQGVLADYAAAGVRGVAHGDIYLEDLRRMRESRLRAAGMRGVFPLWGESTRDLLEEFVALGFRARLTCVEPELGESFVGAELDGELLRRFPDGVDPCGENGEYHSFVYAGPIYPAPLDITTGDIVERDQRFYCDLLLSSGVNL